MSDLFVQVALDYHDDPRVVEAGFSAELVLMRIWSWCWRNRNGGILTRGEAIRRCADGCPEEPGAVIDALVGVGLLRQVPHPRFPDLQALEVAGYAERYGDFERRAAARQAAADEARERRAAAARANGHRGGRPPKTQQKPSDPSEEPTGFPKEPTGLREKPSGNPAVTQPEPSRTQETVEGEGEGDGYGDTHARGANARYSGPGGSAALEPGSPDGAGAPEGLQSPPSGPSPLKASKGRSVAPGAAQRVWDAYVQAIRTPAGCWRPKPRSGARMVLSENHRAVIGKALREYPEDQVAHAVTAWRYDPWITGTDPKTGGTTFYELERLLAVKRTDPGKALWLNTLWTRYPPGAEGASASGGSSILREVMATELAKRTGSATTPDFDYDLEPDDDDERSDT